MMRMRLTTVSTENTERIQEKEEKMASKEG